jgi:hypothetical protein
MVDSISDKTVVSDILKQRELIKMDQLDKAAAFTIVKL